MIEFEEVNCILCGGQDFVGVIEREDLNLFVPGTFRVVRCRNCGLLFQNPRPTSTSWSEIYLSNYDQYQSETQKVRFTAWMQKYGMRKRLRKIEQIHPGGKLCDIGCASGDFLIEVSESSKWDAFGIEPSKEACDLARQRGLIVSNTKLEDVNLEPDTLDVVTMWNVIEHLENPRKSLETINNWLKPGGLIVFNTPNLNSLDHMIFGKYWIGYELPRHYFFFSNSSIASLLSQTGFEQVQTGCYYGSHALSMSSLRFWLRAKTGRVNKVFEGFLFSIPVRLVMAPMYSLLDQLKISSGLTVIARKVAE